MASIANRTPGHSNSAEDDLIPSAHLMKKLIPSGHLMQKLFERSISGTQINIKIHQHFGNKLHMLWQDSENHTTLCFERCLPAPNETMWLRYDLTKRQIPGTCDCAINHNNLLDSESTLEFLSDSDIDDVDDISTNFISTCCDRGSIYQSQKWLFLSKANLRWHQEFTHGPSCTYPISSSASTHPEYTDYINEGLLSSSSSLSSLSYLDL